MLCIAYCNSAAFSGLSVAGSHYYPFPLLFIAVTLAIMFIGALLLYFIKRMQLDCSVTVVISCDFLISTMSIVTLRPTQHLIC